MRLEYLGLAVVGMVLSPTLAHAELRFTQASADLGELRGGPAYQHRFEYVNDSTVPIEIIDIRLGCGCLLPVLEKRTVGPGEKGVLLMHIRTLGQQAGARTWQARVLYRQGNDIHEAGLMVAATLRNEVTVEPSILSMSIGTTLRQEVTITDRRAVPMKITAILASSPAIRVTTKSAGAGVTKVTLEVSAAALGAARQEETLNIYSDDPNYRQLQIPITLVKAPVIPVRASPARVELHGPGAKLVRLRAAGDQTIRVSRVFADHPAIRCTWAAGPGDDATLKIALDPLLVSANSATAVVRVQLDQPASTLTIPVELHKE